MLGADTVRARCDTVLEEYVWELDERRQQEQEQASARGLFPSSQAMLVKAGRHMWRGMVREAAAACREGCGMRNGVGSHAR